MDTSTKIDLLNDSISAQRCRIEICTKEKNELLEEIKEIDTNLDIYQFQLQMLEKTLKEINDNQSLQTSKQKCSSRDFQSQDP